MQQAEQLKQYPDYAVGAVRRHDRGAGVPSIYFMWAAIIAVGWALPDFAPRLVAPFWVLFGIGGGVVSIWLGARDTKRSGSVDQELGRRQGLHWLVTGAAFMVCWLPAMRGAPIETAVGNLMLVAAISYALAGVHLERPLLWSGVLMLAAYVVLTMFAWPYTWTATGLLVAIALAWAGFSSKRFGLPAHSE